MIWLDTIKPLGLFNSIVILSVSAHAREAFSTDCFDVWPPLGLVGLAIEFRPLASPLQKMPSKQRREIGGL
jgi:hypothetical protein